MYGLIVFSLTFTHKTLKPSAYIKFTMHVRFYVKLERFGIKVGFWHPIFLSDTIDCKLYKITYW